MLTLKEIPRDPRAYKKLCGSWLVITVNQWLRLGWLRRPHLEAGFAHFNDLDAWLISLP